MLSPSSVVIGYSRFLRLKSDSATADRRGYFGRNVIKQVLLKLVASQSDWWMAYTDLPRKATQHCQNPARCQKTEARIVVVNHLPHSSSLCTPPSLHFFLQWPSCQLATLAVISEVSPGEKISSQTHDYRFYRFSCIVPSTNGSHI